MNNCPSKPAKVHQTVVSILTLSMESIQRYRYRSHIEHSWKVLGFKTSHLWLQVLFTLFTLTHDSLSEKSTSSPDGFLPRIEGLKGGCLLSIQKSSRQMHLRTQCLLVPLHLFTCTFTRAFTCAVTHSPSWETMVYKVFSTANICFKSAKNASQKRTSTLTNLH